MWEFPTRLVEVDTTFPMSNAEPLSNTLPQTPMLQDPVRNHNPPVAFHPTERGTFFVIVLRGRPPNVLSVCEFKLRDKTYRASRQFDFDVEHYLASCARSSEIMARSFLVDIRHVDACGRLQLLKTDVVEGKTHETVRVIFSPFAGSFSVETYLSPFRSSEATGNESCLWEGQQYTWFADAPSASTSTLLAIEQSTSSCTQVGTILTQLLPDINRMTNAAPELPDQPIDSHSPEGPDVIRCRDVFSKKAMTEPKSPMGFQYALSFRARPCTYSGAHQPYCMSRHLGQASGTHSPAKHPLNHASRLKDYEVGGDACRAQNIYADSSFLVVVLNWGTYTVLCSDATELQDRQSHKC